MDRCTGRRSALRVVTAVVGVLLSASALSAAEVKIPESAQEHLAMAASYREKVKTYLQEVETHQQMLEAYRRKVVVNPRSQYENPWLKKMRKHCERYITEARQLAAEAQKFADYHELMGKELQGQ